MSSSGDTTQLVMIMCCSVMACVAILFGCIMMGIDSIEKFKDLFKISTTLVVGSSSGDSSGQSSGDTTTAAASGSDTTTTAAPGSGTGTTTAAPGSGTGDGWKCIQSCSDNKQYVNVNKTGTTYRCSGPDANNCDWYTAACPTDAPKDTGRSCGSADFDGGWCHAAKALFEKNETPKCDTTLPVKPGTMKSKGDTCSAAASEYSNECLTYCCKNGMCAPWSDCHPKKDAGLDCGFDDECMSNKCGADKKCECKTNPNGRCA